ncbi:MULTISPECIES: IS3 family transposase [unclassified Breznakia]|uniref:IS3 family transposase n=1 Tax=unclassified Breznakia TaxID=2623764 RepID=UPI0024058BD6|nr:MULTISPECIES: IS3 family transposase [unclassified Breznakia]
MKKGNRNSKKVRTLCEAKKIVRFRFIHTYKNRYSISQSAKLLNVTRQGYYRWLSSTTSQRALKHQFLTQEIHRVFKQHEGRYGSPRIAQQLYDEGIETNKRVVAMLMQRAGLVAKGYRKRTKEYGKEKPIEEYIKENLLQRQFDQEVVDYIWVTDITYITCSDGRLYLSTYIDLTTRIPRCYKIATNMKMHIVIDPLVEYIGKLPTIIHGDRGSQYTSHRYQELLENKDIKHSMSAPGTPADNAVIESFHKSIKRELIYPNRHKTKAEMKVLIANYIDTYYIHERIHTKFMMTPYKYQQQISHVS